MLSFLYVTIGASRRYECSSSKLRGGDRPKAGTRQLFSFHNRQSRSYLQKFCFNKIVYKCMIGRRPITSTRQGQPYLPIVCNENYLGNRIGIAVEMPAFQK